MRTLTPSAINININNSSSTSSFDTPSSRPPVPALTSHPGHTTTPSTRSLSASAVNLNQNGKRLPASKSPKSPVTPTPQVRNRFPSAPIVNPDSRSPPLGFHEHKQQQHVLALTTTTRSKTSSASKMPPGESRHRPPQLSAAAAKNVGRTPLTPKIAAKGPTIAALGRRAAQNREDNLNSLSTRSSGRQSRGDSTNTTPNGTPSLERSHEGWDPRAILAIDSMRTSSPGDSGDSKFFYASEARPVQQPPSRPSTAAPKSSNFFYASDAPTEAKRATSPAIKQSFAPMLATPPEPATSKFFYASGTPEVSSKTSLQSGPPSTGSSSSKPVNGRPSTSSSATGSGYSMPQRPMSPIKMLQHHPTPPVIRNTTTPGLNSRPQLTSPPPLAPPSSSNGKRRISVDSAPRSSRGHSRTVSVPSIDSGYSPKIPASPQQPSEPASPPASPLVVQPAMTMASILQAVEDFTEETEDDTPETQPEVQSPTKSTQSADPVTEVVANARRERKVQDLEIRNGSLEAINRTLERQLRKQTAEIRRFRRLSRMSLASAATSRVTSEALPDIPISLADLSEEEDSMLTEEEEEEEEPDSLDDSDLESVGSASNPLESNEKLAVRRNRDERRLRLDLSKHRELLVDSQKINQSLKRCLNWTEVLIKEGQKALEYNVRVSDVEIGGHVLVPPDEDVTPRFNEDLLQGRKALKYSAPLSDVDCGGHMLAPPDEDDASHLSVDEEFLQGLEAGLEPPPLWEKSSQDRDSGIELHAEGL
ncbi:hypothetical protein EDB81DRAFT_393779 [Dactylonectria macrodidyma]|uniref:Uncharacterized protein n=1 Tax=Dactylonectria macrodidyma TaxID=307937 RepID=A0A9P9F9N3_9HYPO|nr:hypothetical protein EDB81DRAFT_393779 [Dactylonectria macrodidyma]